MGTLGGGNGGERPFDGGNQRDGLPGLPPEWGTVVVPDDAADLADEAAEVRRQIRRDNRRRRWRRLLRRPDWADPDEPSIRLPLLIMAIAVVATLVSLFAVTWPKPPRQALPPGQPLADIALVDAQGTPVRLGDVLPAVVVLVQGCDCGRLVSEVAVVARTGVNVLAVAPSVPSVPPPAGTMAVPRTPVRPLADPSNTMRTRLGLPTAAGAGSVVLISRTGQVTRLVPRARSVDEFRMDLLRLR